MNVTRAACPRSRLRQWDEKDEKAKCQLLAGDGVVAVIMAASGALAILHVSQYMEALKHLGYPPYFANLLGIGKLTGVAVLLVPRLGKLKEWAYAAFGIVALAACYSHLCSGDGWLALDPLEPLLR